MKFGFDLLLLSVLFLMRVSAKEIPDDDILKSSNDNKSLDQINSILRNTQQFELGPVDDVIQSILSLRPTYLKEKIDEIGELTQPDTEHTGSKDKENDVTESAEDDDDDGSGVFCDEEYYYNSDEDDYMDTENDDIDNVNDDSENQTKDDKSNIGLDADNLNGTLFSDIEILPLDYNLEDPENPSQSMANYSILLNTLLRYFQKETREILSESQPVSIDTMGLEGADTAGTNDKVRAKRSLYPHQTYEYIWSWHYPFRIFAPYRKSFDTIASGIIGKRSQFDYSEDTDDDLRPIVMS